MEIFEARQDRVQENFGDIDGKYEVKSGDTLWDIAEEIAGEDADDQKIKDEIGFLVYMNPHLNVDLPPQDGIPGDNLSAGETISILGTREEVMNYFAGRRLDVLKDGVVLYDFTTGEEVNDFNTHIGYESEGDYKMSDYPEAIEYANSLKKVLAAGEYSLDFADFEGFHVGVRNYRADGSEINPNGIQLKSGIIDGGIIDSIIADYSGGVTVRGRDLSISTDQHLGSILYFTDATLSTLHPKSNR